MKKLFYTILVSFSLTALAAGCGNSGNNAVPWEKMTPRQRLEAIRKDSAHIHVLDSLAGIHIGEGARCLDAVRHLFVWNGRYWLYSDEWGGLAELPSGWLPEEDLLQSELTFHGTDVWSPDSLVMMRMYSGFDSSENENEFDMRLYERLSEDGISIESWECPKDMTAYGDTKKLITISGHDTNGNSYFGRVFRDGANRVAHFAFLKWDISTEEDIDTLKALVDRFPFGPSGQAPCQND